MEDYMNTYDKINKVYQESILNEGWKKRVAEEDEKQSNEYKTFFKKMLKKFGVNEPDELKGDKRKEFYNAVDKGWKADKETD
jgi:hypothetical protein